MAIYHFSAQVIGRGAGRSAVAAASYRHCAKMEIAGTGEVSDYSRKGGNVFSDFALPDNAPAWIALATEGLSAPQKSEVFWNAVEANEKRHDAQLSKEYIIALPVELSVEQNVEMMREFVKSQITARGIVADWAYHDSDGNPHVHLMSSLRPLSDEGFGAKRVARVDNADEVIRGKDGKIAYEQFSGGVETLRQMREAWAQVQNVHLAKHGFEIRVDHRSFKDMGIDAVPTKHRGSAADNIDERGEVSELVQKAQATARQNYEKYVSNPDTVLERITIQKAVFTRHDIAREISKTECNAEEFQSLFYRVSASEELVPVSAPSFDPFTGEPTSEASFSTKAMVQLEHTLLKNIEGMDEAGFVGVSERQREKAFASFEADHSFALSDEQKNVVRSATSGAGVSVVVGYAGSGKSTTMDALRRSYEAAGCEVIGGALAGLAADNLHHEAGIASRTLASWEYQWSQGQMLPTDTTVFVMDEAGMVSSAQMSRVTSILKEAGAKIVVVGDARQLQPIQAGAAFRAFADISGYSELDSVLRQREEWMREASMAFGRGDMSEGVAAYMERGIAKLASSEEAARSALLDDWKSYHKAGADITIMAHRNKDVIALNAEARQVLQKDGALQNGASFRTERGEREFAAGDKILFLKNERSLGVFNGSSATVLKADQNRLEVQLEDSATPIIVRANEYNQIDYGYARTIHKEQGRTVDHAFVYASPTMDAQLSYVALSRHRETVQLYASQSVFKDEAVLAKSMSQDRLKDSTLLYRNTQDYKDVIDGFAQRRGYSTTETINAYVQAGIQYLRERFDTIAHRFERLRSPEMPEPPKVKITPSMPKPVPAAIAVNSVPLMSEKLAQSLSRLEYLARPIAVGAVRRKGFMRSADYELNIATSAQELKFFNEQMRTAIPLRLIMAQGLERPDRDSRVLSGLTDDWKEFARDNWGKIFAGQRAEQDYTMVTALQKTHEDQKIDNWYEGHLKKLVERHAPEQPFIPASDIPLQPSAIEVRSELMKVGDVRRQFAQIQSEMFSVYVDSGVAAKNVTQEFVKGANLRDIAVRIEQSPEQYGELKGATRLGFANAERKAALARLNSIQERLVYGAEIVEEYAPQVKDDMVKQRAVLRKPVQALSPAAERFMSEAAKVNALPYGPVRDQAFMRLAEDQASVKEVQSFSRAIEVRYRGQSHIVEGIKSEPSLKAMSETDRENFAQKTLTDFRMQRDTLSNMSSVIERTKVQAQEKILGKEISRGYER